MVVKTIKSYAWPSFLRILGEGMSAISWCNINQFAKLGSDYGLRWAALPGWQEVWGLHLTLQALPWWQAVSAQRKELSYCNPPTIGSTYPAFTEVLCVLVRVQSLLLFSLTYKHCEHIYNLFYSFAFLFQM